MSPQQDSLHHRAQSDKNKFLTVIGGTGWIGASVAELAQRQNIPVRIVSRGRTNQSESSSNTPPTSSTEMMEYRQLDITKCAERRRGGRGGTVSKSEENNTSSRQQQQRQQRDDCMQQLAEIVRSSFAVVNCVSLWDAPEEELENIHVGAAESVARACARATTTTTTGDDTTTTRFVHMSGLSADSSSSDPYLRIRGLGDERCLECGPKNATYVLRPGAIIGGPKRGLLPKFVELARMRICPLFGTGSTPMQPITQMDLARVAVHVATTTTTSATASSLSSPSSPVVVDCVGKETMTFKEVLSEVADALRIKWWVGVPLPFLFWKAVASIAVAVNPRAPFIAPAQVRLMEEGNSLIHHNNSATTGSRYKVIPCAELLVGDMESAREEIRRSLANRRVDANI